MRRELVLQLIFVVLLVELARLESVQAVEDSDKPPNVVLIMLDQLRYDTLGFVQAQMPLYKNKLHVRTPNIDLLATQLGTVFETTYCVSPLCAPARTSFMTGCTIQRTGIVGNKGIEPTVYKRMSYFKERVEAMVSIEQILAEDLGYTVESYGKNHYPNRLLYGYKNKSKRVITYNDFDFATEKPGFMYAEAFMKPYRKALQYLLPLDDTVDTSYVNGSQKSFFSELPYMPIRLDPRYGFPTNTSCDVEHGFQKYQCNENYEFGRDTLPENYTSTAVLGEMVLKALDRLVKGEKPFYLEFQINSPHPPRIACSAFLDYYWDRCNDLLVQPSLNDPMLNSGFSKFNERAYKKLEGDKYGYNNASLMAEFTAVYYAMVEEADVWVGKLLDRVYASGIANQTLILFTSDHGELLGAHSMTGKLALLEESTRVPLILSFPGRIPQGATVQNFVSHLDVHATILDYIGAPNHVHLNQSDGKSLRRFIEERAFNEEYDENFVVAESDLREPINETKLSGGELGGFPNFMIRKGRYKLIVPKNATNKVAIDMMYDLELDPFEMDNLLGFVGENASDAVIGKAEHLKILLLEWMSRMDGSNQYYTANKYNNNEGLGSMQEVEGRRTWRSVNYWQSENTTLLFGRPCRNKEGAFIRNEYLYIGRTLEQPDDLIVDEIAVDGPDAKFFSVDVTQARIPKIGHIRIKVSFTATELLEFQSLTAWIRIHSNVAGLWKILIHVADAPSVVPAPAPVPPTLAPFRLVSRRPTKAPINAPTKAPIIVPTEAPSVSEPPSDAPTKKPTQAPILPTPKLSRKPSITLYPTDAPTKTVTRPPTLAPTHKPTLWKLGCRTGGNRCLRDSRCCSGNCTKRKCVGDGISRPKMKGMMKKKKNP